MSDPVRIGVFGGTFDPVHNAHLDIARVACEEARLDRILFVVSARPPHKTDSIQATAEDRFAMVEAALAGSPHWEASRLELDREGPSYMVDTLKTLSESIPDAALHLIVGMDSLIDLPNWRNVEGILSRAHLLVVPRPGDAVPPASLAGHYTILHFTPTELSSTTVRDRIVAGEDVSGLIPGDVRRYIEEKGIYCACA